MAVRRIEFDANSLLKLMVHYTQDSEVQVPLDAELRYAGFSAFLPRWIVLEVESKEWNGVEVRSDMEELPFLHVRYEGKKVASWGADSDQPVEWKDSVEAPK